ncbi:unnamed protein product [Lactuca virosa]|uniref:Uncharacterized protein n=1 Tax=Lactuca virosa TaxID=75947 RepID=A0AAU9MIY0_9ASTR|nr:unnamed protein product [Lactuca virosa]
MNSSLLTSEHIVVMSSISDLKCEGVRSPLQVRIIRNWRHDVRRYETWYLAVDRFWQRTSNKPMDGMHYSPTKFNRDVLIPLPAITVVAVTNLKPSVSASSPLVP